MVQHVGGLGALFVLLVSLVILWITFFRVMGVQIRGRFGKGSGAQGLVNAGRCLVRLKFLQVKNFISVHKILVPLLRGGKRLLPLGSDIRGIDILLIYMNKHSISTYRGKAWGVFPASVRSGARVYAHTRAHTREAVFFRFPSIM